MKPHIFVIPLLALSMLSACFMSEVARIETGEMLARGPVALCTPDDPPCMIAVPSGDGYVVESPDEDEDDLLIRFEHLTDAGGVPVYLGEVALSDGDDSAWSYIVARPVVATVDEAPRFDIAMPGCGEMDRALDAEFGITRADAYACTVTDLAGLRAYLTQHYAERFADPDWWADAD